MARKFANSSVSGLVALCAMAHAQVGPPVDGAWMAPASNQTLAVETGSQTEVGALEAQGSTAHRTLPAESSIPLMAAPESTPLDSAPPASSGGGWTRSLASVALVVGLLLVLAAVIRFALHRSSDLVAEPEHDGQEFRFHHARAFR